MLPGCWWLTEHQVEGLVGYLDGGGQALASGDLAVNEPSAARDRLRTHPNLTRCAPADLVANLPGGPQVVASGEIAVNLHQLDDGVAAHLINYGYDQERDAVAVVDDLELTVRLPKTFSTAMLLRPGRPPEALELRRDGDAHCVRLGAVGLYVLVVLR